MTFFLNYVQRVLVFSRPQYSPQQSNAKNRFSKFDREHALSLLFRFWSIYSPIGTKIEITTKKRVPGRISKNGFLHLIAEGLENTNTVGTYFKKKSKPFCTVPYVMTSYYLLRNSLSMIDRIELRFGRR